MANFSTRETGQPVPNNFHDGENKPGKARNRNPKESNNVQKVEVVYYLSRNGQMGHPYIIEVPLSSPQRLQLMDVIDALNAVQGQVMASTYSWSFKRKYRKGFVWQDLLDTDFISPCNGHDYILKGSLLVGTYPKFQSYETTSPSASRMSSEIDSCGEEDSSTSPSMRRGSHSLATFDNLDFHKDHNDRTSEQFASECTGMSMETERIEHLKTTGASLTDPSTLKSPSRASQVLERLTKAKSADKVGDGMVVNEPSPGRKKAYAPLLKMFLGCASRKLQVSPERQHQGYSSFAIHV